MIANRITDSYIALFSFEYQFILQGDFLVQKG